MSFVISFSMQSCVFFTEQIILHGMYNRLIYQFQRICFDDYHLMERKSGNQYIFTATLKYIDSQVVVVIIDLT